MIRARYSLLVTRFAVAGALAAAALAAAAPALAQSGAFVVDPKDGSILVADPAPRQRFALMRPGRRTPLTFDALDEDLLAVSPTDNLLVLADRGDALTLRDSEGKRQGDPIRPDIGEIVSLQFAADGRTALAISAHRRVAVLALERRGDTWRLAVGARFRVVANDAPRARFLPGTDLIVAGDTSHALRFFRRDGTLVGETLRFDLGIEGGFDRLVLDPAGKWLATKAIMDCSNYLKTYRLAPGAGAPKPVAQGAIDWCSHNYAEGFAVSPAGDRVAIAGSGEVRLHAPDGKRVATLAKSRKTDEIDPDLPRSLAYAPSGKVLLGWSREGPLRLWSAAGQPLGKPMKPHEGALVAARFAPGRDLLVTADEAGAVRFWEVPAMKRVGEFALGNSDVERLAVAADGTAVAQTALRGQLRLWSAALLPGGTIETGHTAPVGTLAFSPDGALLVAVTRDRKLARVLRRDTGAPVGKPIEVNGLRMGLPAFSPRATLMAVPGGYGHNVIVDYAAPDRSRRLESAIRPLGIFALGFSPTEDVLFAGTREGTILVFGHDGKQIGAPLWQGDDAVVSLAVSPDGRTLAVGLEDGTVHLLARDGAAQGAPIRAHAGPVSALAFSADGERLATAGGDRDAGLIFVTVYEGQASFRVWSRDGKPVSDSATIARGIAAIAFLPGERALAIEDRRGLVAVHGLDGARRTVLWAD